MIKSLQTFRLLLSVWNILTNVMYGHHNDMSILVSWALVGKDFLPKTLKKEGERVEEAHLDRRKPSRRTDFS